MSATYFAAPTILFAEPVLSDADAEAGLKPCATGITVRLKLDPTEMRDRSRALQICVDIEARQSRCLLSS
jgi:hypothetical protein